MLLSSNSIVFISMIKFDIITILPNIFDSFKSESLIARAIKKRIIKVNVYNLRDWTNDRHKTVDDRPFGGGLGMVMKVEPIYKATKELKRKKSKVIVFTPRGKKFNQKIAYELSRMEQLIFICGRYEGIDERVAKNIADLELSMGDYVSMGGEVPAMMVIESISRLIKGVISKEQLLKERITKGKGFIEYEQYTRPEIFEPKKGIKWRVPKVLLSGNHKDIEEWKKKHGKNIEK